MPARPGTRSRTHPMGNHRGQLPPSRRQPPAKERPGHAPSDASAHNANYHTVPRQTTFPNQGNFITPLIPRITSKFHV
jgi:hypothetical protein